jgi:putative membrane protein insertion efficiency factor
MASECGEFCTPALAQGVREPHAPALMARVLIALVRLYQMLLSPFLGGQCRFEPSCSRYAIAALKDHGALRGGLLSVRRVCKCSPFHPGGVDLPPPARRP